MQVNCLAISDDKSLIVAGGNPHLRVYDVANSANSTPVASRVRQRVFLLIRR